MKLYQKLTDQSRSNLVETAQPKEGWHKRAARGDNSKRALEYINHNPGVTVSQVVQAAGYATYGGAHAWLDRAAQKGKIKKKHQDGQDHFYANNYLFAAERRVVKPITEALNKELAAKSEPVEQPKLIRVEVNPNPVAKDWPLTPAERVDFKLLEELAKDYAWASGRTETTLVMKEFVNWARQGGSK